VQGVKIWFYFQMLAIERQRGNRAIVGLAIKKWGTGGQHDRKSYQEARPFLVEGAVEGEQGRDIESRERAWEVACRTQKARKHSGLGQ